MVKYSPLFYFVPQAFLFFLLCSLIIPLSVLQLYTGKELEMLVCGRREVDIDLLHQNTKLSGVFTVKPPKKPIANPLINEDINGYIPKNNEYMIVITAEFKL